LDGVVLDDAVAGVDSDDLGVAFMVFGDKGLLDSEEGV